MTVSISTRKIRSMLYSTGHSCLQWKKQSIFSDKFKSFWHICLSCYLPNDPLTSEKLWNQPFHSQLNSPDFPEGNQASSQLFSRNKKEKKKRPKNTTPLLHNNGCILNLLVWFSKQYHFFFSPQFLLNWAQPWDCLAVLWTFSLWDLSLHKRESRLLIPIP